MTKLEEARDRLDMAHAYQDSVLREQSTARIAAQTRVNNALERYYEAMFGALLEKKKDD